MRGRNQEGEVVQDQGSAEGQRHRRPDSRRGTIDLCSDPLPTGLTCVQQASVITKSHLQSHGTLLGAGRAELGWWGCSHQADPTLLIAFSKPALPPYLPEEREDGGPLPFLTSSFYQKKALFFCSLQDPPEPLASLLFALWVSKRECQVQYFQKVFNHRALLH